MIHIRLDTPTDLRNLVATQAQVFGHTQPSEVAALTLHALATAAFLRLAGAHTPKDRARLIAFCQELTRAIP